MKHCCNFEANDIWYLKDTEEFSNRVLLIGNCPICGKHLCELYQKSNLTNSIVSQKRVGSSTKDFLSSLIDEKLYSRNELNKMKFVSKPFGWRYGVNKQKKSKDGSITIEQYAVDFYGNSEMIKKI